MNEQSTPQAASETTATEETIIYGADWCGDCRRAKAALDRFGVAYNLHDIEHEDGAAEKAIAISGQQHIPVIRFAADGSWLVEPSATQLQAKCKELGLL